MVHLHRRRLDVLRPRLASVLALGLVVVSTVVLSQLAQRVVDDNEDRLLAQRAAQVELLFAGLGDSFEADVVSATVAAQAADGDPAAFERFVTQGDEATETPSTWVLLERTPEGLVPTTATGPSLLGENRGPEVDAALAEAADGGFVVVPLAGEESPLQALGIAAGRPDVPGDLVAVRELSLVQAATGSAEVEGFEDVGLELYLGDEAVAQERVFAIAMDEVVGGTAARPFELGGQRFLLRVGATEPLTGSLTDRLPVLLLAAGLAAGVLVAFALQVTLVRRDHALALVDELETKNAEVERAIEEQRRAEAANDALEDELRRSQRLEAVGRLAGGVAHDFNNLLAAIMSFAELAEGGADDPSVRDDLAEIRRAAERGADLTRQLLAFSRREGGEVERVDVGHVVDDLRRLLGRTLPDHVDLVVRRADDLPAVLADAGELEQLVLNLVVNARDAIGESPGRIDLALDQVELGEADVVALPGIGPGPAVRLQVCDDGGGMAPDVQARAFEPFFTTKGSGTGTGLGLATAYGVVRRSGGHIGIASTPGEGTTFTVHLPAAGPTAHAPAPGADAPPEGRGERVLLVEDEAPVRRATRRILQRAGYQVVDAADGSLALDAAHREAPDLLLSDLAMPGGLTGVDVAEQLRARRPDLPVVLMTGHSGEAADGPTLAAWRPILRKPYATRTLLEAVRAALDGAPVDDADGTDLADAAERVR